MKKICLVVLSTLLLSTSYLRADEGMWLLPLIEKLNIKAMHETGLKLTAEEIYSINTSSIKDAIVHFGGGCTGEIISGEGLLITNHHCGYGNIRRLSTVEHDYLKDGYWAMNRSQELPAEGLTVTFLESFTDVTLQIEAALSKAKSLEDRDKIYRSATESLVKKAVGNNKHMNARVTDMYGGNAYYLIVSKTYRDVRFVGAPPSSVGKFGGDTDNWMWPRHTGDFSMFRVYADKDNNPAAYSPDNVPYKPKQHLKVSLKGFQEGDFAMIMGYPGRTNRFMTASELVETRDISNAISIYVRGIRQELMMEDMLADPKVKIQYASKHSGSSNGWKKWIGMNETFAKLGVEERTRQEEKKFLEWANRDPARKAKYGEALNKINKAVDGRRDATILFRYLAETLSNIEVASYANRVGTMFEQLIDPKTKKKDKETIIERINMTGARFFPDYSEPTDRKISKAMIRIFNEEVTENKLPSFYKDIADRFNGSIDDYVDYVFTTTIFTDPAKVEEAVKNMDTKILEDPAYLLSKSYMSMMGPLREEINKDQRSFLEGRKLYIAGTLEMREGEAIYPDANSTMRLTYGQILSYSPRDAVHYNYYTTIEGIMEKEDPNNPEFIVPQRLKDLYNAKDYGQYANEKGEMIIAFLSNNDITGGNSGSPVLNDKGELLGLAFDGNWESMSGDIIFEPQLQRCINVDIRYCLFIVDKYGGAGYLLDEMTIVK